MEETLPPSRSAIARSTMNMTTTPTHGSDFGNDTQVNLSSCCNVVLVILNLFHAATMFL